MGGGVDRESTEQMWSKYIVEMMIYWKDKY